jgi:hypothetical protein
MMKKISCPRCGNQKEFAVVVASVFSIYINGNGKTLSRESLADSCSGVDRVECSLCLAEIDNVRYSFKDEKAIIFEKVFAEPQSIQVKRSS